MRLPKKHHLVLLAALLPFFSCDSMAVDNDDDVPAINDVKSAVDQVDSDLIKYVDNNTQVARDNAAHLQKLLGELFKDQNQKLRDLMAESLTAEAKMRAMDLYAGYGKDPYECDYGNFTQEVQKGLRNMATRGVAAGKSMDERANSTNKTKDVIDEALVNLKKEDVELEKVYPQNGTRTEEDQKKYEEMAKIVIDPTPPLQLSTKIKQTESGKRYEARRQEYEASKKVSRAAQIESGVNPKSPSLDWSRMDYAKKVLADLGMSEQDAGVRNGKISYVSLMRVLAQGKVHNKKWMEQLIKSSEKDLLVELNRNVATSLDLQERQYELMLYMTEILAQQNGKHVDDQYLPELNTLYESAVSKK